MTNNSYTENQGQDFPMNKIKELILKETDNNDERTQEDALKILEAAEKIYQIWQDCGQNYPSLTDLFVEEFGDPTQFEQTSHLFPLCLKGEYLFPEQQQLAFLIEESVSSDLLNSAVELTQNWWDAQIQAHNRTKELLSASTSYEDLECHCHECLGNFRGYFRNQLYDQCAEILNQSAEQIGDLMVEYGIDEVSQFLFKQKQKIDQKLKKSKTILRKNSIAKIDKELQVLYRELFGNQSEIFKAYLYKVKAYCLSLLEEWGHRNDFLSEEEYERFFHQLNLNLWKPRKAIKREFSKTVRSLLGLKRKDISATILKQYLGEFWLFSKARNTKRKIIYHMGPTNSGKTYHAVEALAQAQNGCYLAPLRLLAGELYDTLTKKGLPCTLLTGEEVIEDPDATHFSSTVEMAKLHEAFECVVIDEIQMMADPQRGWAWTRALINMNAHEVHLCGDGSVLELVEKILKLTGDELEVKNYQRMTELIVQESSISLESLRKGDALVVFSRRNALRFKSELESKGLKVSIVYGRLGPEVRREQARKFDEGETDVIVSTDAIAMGMNLPVKRIVFSTLSKYIDNKQIPLRFSEIKQIAGRAGRYGRFPVGHVTCLSQEVGGIQQIRTALETKLQQKDRAMVGPDMEIYRSVNSALEENLLPTLGLPEFLLLFNTMTFQKPFYCVELREMIELAEMVEGIDSDNTLSDEERFGFACAPVNMGIAEHVEYYLWMAKRYALGTSITNQEIFSDSDDIDYLETRIKCVELFQWLARHFQNKFFSFDSDQLLKNKGQAIEKLNELLSQHTRPEKKRFHRKKKFAKKNTKSKKRSGAKRF